MLVNKNSASAILKKKPNCLRWKQKNTDTDYDMMKISRCFNILLLLRFHFSSYIFSRSNTRLVPFSQQFFIIPTSGLRYFSKCTLFFLQYFRKCMLRKKLHLIFNTRFSKWKIEDGGLALFEQGVVCKAINI